MTGTDIVTAVRAEVVEPNPAFFTSATLLVWINNAQRDYVRKVRCLQNFATTSTVQGQSDYPMPSDWLGAERVFYNRPINGTDNWRPLTPTTLTKIGQESPNFLSSATAAQGAPTHYYIVNKTLFLYPRPDTTGTSDIYMFYEAKPIALTALTDPLSIDDSLSDGIEAYVLWKMWKMDGEDQLAQEQLDRYKMEIGFGLKWKKKQILEGKYKMDIESNIPVSYSAGGLLANQVNPLEL